ncbi:LOW QUALITY PROTEIN: THAP domain-containing protein 8 [Trichechus inunguis]
MGHGDRHYCRAPNCFNTDGRLGDDRPVSFYQFPLTDGSRLQAWLRHTGREHWVPSCREHLRSERVTPACVLWRWGFRYLRPDAGPSVFPRAPPPRPLIWRGGTLLESDSQRFPPWGRKVPKRREARLPPPQGPAPLRRDPAVSAPGPVHVVVLGPAPARSEAPTSALLAPRALPPATRARPGAALGALRRVRRLQRRHERPLAQPLRALDRWVQQLRRASARLALPARILSLHFTIVCRGPDVAVVLAQGPAPSMDVKPELLDKDPNRQFCRTDDRRQMKTDSPPLGSAQSHHSWPETDLGVG